MRQRLRKRQSKTWGANRSSHPTFSTSRDLAGDADERRAAANRAFAKRNAVVHGLKNAADLLDSIKAGTAHYDFVEVMACRRGCILGGGQPVPMGPTTRTARMNGIYEVDQLSSIRYTDENPLIERIWDDLIKGHEHELLHRAGV